ncbi:MAG: sulfur carrier protein ThiS [Gammaproteobacteria bacterium]|jgi:sulfur carrier protein|nr:sulfur carrier protein ThiS [Gammaproteobacteria bacterium]
MVIFLNGKEHKLPDHSTAADLVQQLKLGERRIAMEINHEIVPRSRYETQPIQAGDKVEVVHAIGGGSGLFEKKETV